MYHNLTIRDVYAREILDSRGNPTIEAEVLAGENIVGRAGVPSGVSTGAREAKELRDQGERYGGKGVRLAVDQVNARIAPQIIGMNVYEQEKLDEALRRLDKTPDKSGLGANAMLSVSLAAAKAAAASLHMPLYAYLGGVGANRMPKPMMNILNGGAHASNSLDFQAFMIVPVAGNKRKDKQGRTPDEGIYRESLRMGAEIYRTLKNILEAKGYPTLVGDEGGFAPDLKDTAQALDLLTEAVQKSGYTTGKDVWFAIDAAASGLHQADAGMYDFPGESRMTCPESAARLPDTVRTGILRSTDEMIAYYQELVSRYPICAIEDPLGEEDWDGWKKLTEQMGARVMLAGDDLFVTNRSCLERGVREGCANAILIQPNQIGTLSETMDTVRAAREAGYRVIVGHRSGETEDTTIADLAVAFQAEMIKTGAPCRSERTAKYNRLLRIEEELL